MTRAPASRAMWVIELPSMPAPPVTRIRASRRAPNSFMTTPRLPQASSLEQLSRQDARPRQERPPRVPTPNVGHLQPTQRQVRLGGSATEHVHDNFGRPDESETGRPAPVDEVVVCRDPVAFVEEPNPGIDARPYEAGGVDHGHREWQHEEGTRPK